MGLAALLAFPAGADFAAGERAHAAGDYRGAYDHWLPLAVAGDRDAQAEIGRLYRKGQGIPRNYRRALNWFLRASKQGHLLATNSIGIMFDNGSGVPKDDKRTECWYRLAAERGYANAQYNLAIFYVERERFEESRVWRKRARNQGQVGALVWLANAMMMNIIRPDKIPAYALYHYGAIQGDEFSIAELKKIRASADEKVRAELRRGRGLVKKLIFKKEKAPPGPITLPEWCLP